jgi:methionine salvage enolase-phosphatase E1
MHVEGLVPISEDSEDKEAFIESIVKNVEWQMVINIPTHPLEIDRKIGPLKDLQGYIWKTAYEKGEIQGVVYDDVVEGINSLIES